jgi:mono/diheme cytochrome c family protein
MNPETNQSNLNDGAVAPMWLIVLFGVLLYAGALYFDAHGGDFNPQVYAPIHSYADLLELQPSRGPEEELIHHGEQIYLKTCGQCHQASGLGAAGQFPPLCGSEWVNEPDPARVIRIALAGAQGPFTVKGQEWNLIMSLNATTLGIADADLAAVLSYVRNAWGNKAPVVTEAQIKAAKEDSKGHPLQWTAQELNAVPVKK